jgi:hypothetical protein
MKRSVSAHERAWAATVAKAVPAIPHLKAKMKRGASAALRTVPLTVAIIADRGLFCERRLFATAIDTIWKMKPIVIMPM